MFKGDISKIIEELIDPRVSIRSQFRLGDDSRIPVTQLDWGATSQLLGYVEERVRDILWNRYGNPHSCGTLTGTLTKKVLDDCRTRILSQLLGGRALEDRYGVEFGGEGSTHWLEKIPGGFSPETHSPICIQRELHNSLVDPWIEGGWEVSFPPEQSQQTWGWFSRRLRYTRETERKTPVLLLSLSSHTTGGVLRLGKIREYLREGDVVILDATCYLTHHRTTPDIPFDFLVFSGHKLPGGPGSPGCVLFDRQYSSAMARKRGTENVPGIVRLTEALILNSHLLRQGRERSLRMMNGIFRGVRRGTCSLLPVLWDTEDIYEDRREPIYSFVIEYGNKLIHPDVVADLLLHLFGLQIRVGGLCSDYSIPAGDALGNTPDEWMETSGMQTILRPSVCRISIPEYLLTETLVLRIEGAIRDIITYGHHLLQSYVPTLEGWGLHPDAAERLTVSDDREVVVQGCRGCPGKRGKTVIEKTASTNNPPPDSADLMGRMMALALRHSPEDQLLSHPYRWFIHPLDDLVGGEEDRY